MLADVVLYYVFELPQSDGLNPVSFYRETNTAMYDLLITSSQSSFLIQTLLRYLSYTNPFPVNVSHAQFLTRRASPNPWVVNDNPGFSRPRETLR